MPVDRAKITFLAVGCSVFGLTWLTTQLLAAVLMPANLGMNALTAGSNTLPVRAIPTAFFVSRPFPAEPLRIAESNAQDDKGPSLIPLDSFRQLTLKFEGTAKCGRTPCTDATVLVQVTSGNYREATAGFTTPDGHYSVQIPVQTRVSEAVDWTLEAYAPASKKLQITGRRITTDADTNNTTIPLKASLALVPKS